MYISYFYTVAQILYTRAQNLYTWAQNLSTWTPKKSTFLLLFLQFRSNILRFHTFKSTYFSTDIWMIASPLFTIGAWFMQKTYPLFGAFMSFSKYPKGSDMLPILSPLLYNFPSTTFVRNIPEYLARIHLDFPITTGDTTVSAFSWSSFSKFLIPKCCINLTHQ